MISCTEAVRRLWEYLDRDLDAGERDRVDQHLAFCRRCCGELEFARELSRMLRTRTTPGLPGDVRVRLETLIDGLEREAT